MKRLFITLVGAAALISSTALSQVVVPVRPPRVIVERPIPRPGPGYVWLPGYYRWAGARYVWVPGRYEIPPRPGVVWVAPHWVHRNGSWVFIAGYWH